ncbi:pilus assembly protein N-terminal domain-containing protein [Bradyrhizobium mercantei]|uniref:pilus assembly protein N-terminal domain-containing protein n=1 Tax=Bradyrhizobium mercantei TaxID=1904807 RepID=UPI000977C089|nr:pilus assembly protein N-terminal domain-containing protein [Bradyrhizobium mercantei]
MIRFAVALFALTLPFSVQAQTTAKDPSQGAPMKGEIISAVEQVKVGLGQAKLIKFNRMIGDIQASVNNVVRSSVLGDKFLLSVTGVSPGATDLVVVNQYGDVMYIAHVTVSPGLDQTQGDAPHIVRTYGWSEAKKSGGNSIVTIVNGDSKGGGNSDSSVDFVERSCNSTGCSQPISPAAQAAGLDQTDPQKQR